MKIGLMGLGTVGMGVYELLNRNKLYEISQSIYGMGIATYVRKKRVDIAKKCLNDGMTVAEAAEKSGFYDYNYFSKIFKRETGIVPSKFI